jgi:hydroxymethylpyrimidine pyrophosphatase-like HAD family hydrolase
MTRVVFVDVDDTLVRSVGTTRIPMPAVVARVRALKESGADIFLWSSGGAEYCRATAQMLGLADYVDGYLPKPTLYIDDQPIEAWRDCRHVHPLDIANA